MSDKQPMFEITKAVRSATPALINIWGPSSSGKTLTSLLIARGLVGPEGKIGLIDTENKRALYHADKAGGWEHLDYQPPFSPDRYTGALNVFEDKGIGCVIIDSTSHVWEGEGGVLDMAESGTNANGSSKNGLNKWNKPKSSYKRMINNMLRAPFHVIFCLRSKDGYSQKGFGKDAKIENVGLIPIMGKDFIYEMTVSVLLGLDHKPVFPGDNSLYHSSPSIPSVKAPDELYSLITPGEYLGEPFGRKMASWIEGGKAVDHHAENVKKIARDIANYGMEKLKEHGGSQTDEDKTTIRSIWPELSAIANEVDAQKEAEQEETQGSEI